MSTLTTNLKKTGINLCVLLVTVALGLLLCEFASRLFLNPADFLSVALEKDPILGGVPSPAAQARFDAWGFRNRGVPETADIVAIGDSQTYGNTATMEESWPYVLGRLKGQSVYNMSVGGYGPNQYFYLLKTKALRLRPRIVLCGLSLTDDFDNAFRLTYGLDYWASFRSLPGVKIDFDTWDADADANPSWHKKIRMWLSQHSVIYQLVIHRGMGDRLKGEVQIREAAQLYPGQATALAVPQSKILEAFQPTGNLRRLDQNSQSVQEGMRITFELLKEMNEICQKNHAQFVVVVIPTKEMVFSRYLEQSPNMPLSDVVHSLLTNERLAMDRTFQFLTSTNIPYVDPLPALQKSAGLGLFAKSAGDMHPNKNGYRIIGEAVAERLSEMEKEKQVAGSAE